MSLCLCCYVSMTFGKSNKEQSVLQMIRLQMPRDSLQCSSTAHSQSWLLHNPFRAFLSTARSLHSLTPILCRSINTLSIHLFLGLPLFLLLYILSFQTTLTILFASILSNGPTNLFLAFYELYYTSALDEYFKLLIPLDSPIISFFNVLVFSYISV